MEKELKGPGKLLGYRAMHKKIRLEHGLNVTRDQVHDVMTELDPQGLEAHGTMQPRGSKRKETSPPVVPTGSILWMDTISSYGVSKLNISISSVWLYGYS